MIEWKQHQKVHNIISFGKICFFVSTKSPAFHIIDGEVLLARQRFVVKSCHRLWSTNVEILVEPQAKPSLTAADDEVVIAGPHDVVVLSSPGVNLESDNE